ncbi:cytochrome P450 [Streptomyces sp. NPDC059850]|uniref:cytochrome P450 n=1 Tax=Streptomyces sp. NPDC059850 TaxID=3346970 RepID=UPI003660B98A
MTNIVNAANAEASEFPEFPMPRAHGCPFDPPPAFHALREEGPLTRVRLRDGSTPWVVTRYAEQRTLLADPRLSVLPAHPGFPRPEREYADTATAADTGDGDAEAHGLSFINMDDPEHARLRRMVTGPFTIKRMEAMRPAVQKIVDDRIDDLLAGPNPTDLVEAFTLPVPSLVICELLGVPYQDHAFFQANSKAIITRSSTPEQRSEAHRRLGGYLGELLDAKHDQPGEDVLSDLAAKVRDGALTRQEATSMAVLLLFAGHETTANMIALGTLALLEHPDQLARLRESDDPAFVAGAVEELLRYLHIPHLGMRRVALEDIEVAGRTIRAGEGLLLLNEMGNRDPDVFPGADRLDLHRDARRHVTFSFGVHQCLGQPLARMELQVVYSTLYKRIPTLRLATGLEQIPFKHDSFVYGVHELPVAW